MPPRGFGGIVGYGGQHSKWFQKGSHAAVKKLHAHIKTTAKTKVKAVHKFKKGKKTHKMNEKATRTPIGSQSWAKVPHVGKVQSAVLTVAKSQPSFFYTQCGTQRITAGVGKQTAQDVLTVLGTADMHNLQIQTETQSPNTTYAVTEQNIFVDSVIGELLFTNQTLGPCHMQIFDVVSRRDIDNSSYDDPVSCINTGIGHDIGNTVDITQFGVTPFQSQLFTTNFKVMKITDVMLTQGAVHQHKFNYKVRRYLKGSYINENYVGDNGAGCYKGMTYGCFIIIHGYPENDSTTKSQVSTGAVAVDLVSKWAIEFKPVTLSRPQSNYTSSGLPSSFSVGGEIVDVGSGAITADAEA